MHTWDPALCQRNVVCGVVVMRSRVLMCDADGACSSQGFRGWSERTDTLVVLLDLSIVTHSLASFAPGGPPSTVYGGIVWCWGGEFCFKWEDGP